MPRIIFTIICCILLLTAALLALRFVVYPWFVHHQVLAMNSRVQNDMHTLSTALQSYALDHGQFPPPDAGPDGWLVAPAVLTTPVAYLSRLIDDYYVNGPDIPFGYRLIGHVPVKRGH